MMVVERVSCKIELNDKYNELCCCITMTALGIVSYSNIRE